MSAPGLILPPLPTWTTACPDWEQRLLDRQSLVPFEPLFPDEAEAALEIFRGLRLKDVAGTPTIGEVCLPWVYDLPRVLFGMYDHDGTGRRLVRYFLWLVAKKNTKSTLAAAIMLTALMRNWRNSAEFYILAPTKEIADNAFAPARDMIRLDDGLRDILRIQEASRIITHRNTGAFLKVVASDSETVAGKKTVGLFVDELWLFDRRADADSMLREAMGGLASRPEGFVIYASTHSARRPTGVFKDRLEKFRDVRDGKIDDPKSLMLGYEFPKHLLESKDYKDPKWWHVTNPNLGKSVDLEYLLEQRAEAERDGAAKVIDFEAKHLNVPAGQSQRIDGWVGAMLWPNGAVPGLTLDDILARSEVVTIGLDSGGLDDLIGVALIGREKGTKRWLAWTHGLVSVIGVVRRKTNAVNYLEFVKDEDLDVYRLGPIPVEGEDDPNLEELIKAAKPAPPITTTEHSTAEERRHALRPHVRFIVDLVERVRDLGLLAQVGVDAARIGVIVDALDDIGVTQEAETLDVVAQGIKLMNAVFFIEQKLADGTFVHSGSKMMEWCVGNVRIVPTPTASRVARDESGAGKIDPFVALANAAHMMSLNPEPADGGPSKYEHEDLKILRF